MAQYLKYIGSDFILGEIVGENAVTHYWLVRRFPTKQDPTQRIVCHPKWDTEVIKEDDLRDYI